MYKLLVCIFQPTSTVILYIIHDYVYMYKIIMIRSASYKNYSFFHKQIQSSVTCMKCRMYRVYQTIDTSTKCRITRTNLIKHFVYSFAILRIAQNWYQRSKILWNKEDTLTWINSCNAVKQLMLKINLSIQHDRV